MFSFALAALKHWKWIGLGLLILALSIQTVRLGHRSNQLDRAKINLNECREGRKQDRQTYEQGQRDAKARNDADIQRIEQEQERINEEAKSRYHRDLARLRSGGLRKELTAPQSPPGSPGAGPDGPPPSGADAEKLCLDRSVVLRAAEGELRLNALIDWVNAQLGVKR